MGIQSQHSWKTLCTPPAQSGSSPTFGERTRETRVGPGEKYPPLVTGMGGVGRQQGPSLLDLQMPIYCARWGSAQAQGIAKQPLRWRAGNEPLGSASN